MRVEILPLEPLAAVPALHGDHRDVVRAGVTEDVAHRVGLGDVAAGPPDDRGELDLPVELLRVGRGKENRRIRAGHGRRVLREERGEFGDILSARLRRAVAEALSFLEVLAVVPAYAEHVSPRHWDGGTQFRAFDSRPALRLRRGRANAVPHRRTGCDEPDHVLRCAADENPTAVIVPSPAITPARLAPSVSYVQMRISALLPRAARAAPWTTHHTCGGNT